VGSIEFWVSWNHSCNLNAQTWTYIHGWIPPSFPMGKENWAKSEIHTNTNILEYNDVAIYLSLVSILAHNLTLLLVQAIPLEISWTITGTKMSQYESPAMYTSFERNFGWSISHYTDLNMTITTYSSYSQFRFAKLKL